MPKIHGTSLIGILLATVAFYMLGFMWYGFIFHEAWLTLSGMTEAEAQASAERLGAVMWIGGIGITLLQVIGLNYVLHHAGANRWKKCVEIGLIIAFLFALPLMGYYVLYQGENPKVLWIDFGHIAIGYALVGVILAAFRGKDALGTPTS